MAHAFSTASSASLFSLALAGYFLLAAIAQAGTPDRGKSAAAAVLAENDAAMATMMDATTIKPSGNVDADFAAMRLALGQSLPPSLASPTYPAPAASDVSRSMQPAGRGTAPLPAQMELRTTFSRSVWPGRPRSSC